MERKIIVVGDSNLQQVKKALDSLSIACVAASGIFKRTIEATLAAQKILVEHKIKENQGVIIVGYKLEQSISDKEGMKEELSKLCAKIEMPILSPKVKHSHKRKSSREI